MPQLTAECRSMLEGRNFDHVVAHEPDDNAEHFAKLVTEYRGGRPMVDRGTPRHGHGRKPRWRVGHRERLGSRCTGTETAAGRLRRSPTAPPLSCVRRPLSRWSGSTASA
jgi:hypothetical protein